MRQGEEEGEILGTHLKLAAGQVGLIILCERVFSCLLHILIAERLERAFPNHAWAKKGKQACRWLPLVTFTLSTEEVVW